MAKDLPYFKFDVAEWINGLITLESDSAQGLFINICAHYWFKSGNLSLSEIKRRLLKSKPEDFQALTEAGILKVVEDQITITFLDDQLKERAIQSQVNSANGKRGGRPKTETKPTALISLNGSKAKKSNIEEKRIEENREEIMRAIFSEEIYLEGLQMTHKGKDLRQAFNECYNHHSVLPNPPQELYEWKQKLNTWLTRVKAISSNPNPGKI